MTIVNQMLDFIDKISDETIVANVLKSLTLEFDQVMATIEETKIYQYSLLINRSVRFKLMRQESIDKKGRKKMHFK